MTHTPKMQTTYPDQAEPPSPSLTYSKANIMSIFFDECETLLHHLDASLIEVSNGNVDKDTIETIFHSIHSIHEGASALGFTDLQNFARVFDATLNKMCSNQNELTHSIFQILLQSSTMLEHIFIATRDNQSYDRPLANQLVQALKDCRQQHHPDSLLHVNSNQPTIEELNFQPIMLDFDFCNTPLTGE